MSRPARPAPTLRRLLLVLLTAAVPLACSESRDAYSTEDEVATEEAGGYSSADRVDHLEAPPPAAVPAPQAPGAVGRGAGVQDGAGADATRQASVEDLDTVAVPRMVIRTGHASVEVDSLDAAVGAARRLAEGVGGWVANVSIQTGDERLRRAEMEIRVPADRWDRLLEGLEPLGELESVQVDAQDVGEEYVDLRARQANARRLEDRLVALLERRTGDLAEVLAVERELARVREGIERTEGRMRFLRARAAVSTLRLSLHEPVPVVGDYPGSSVIGDAFRQAWRNFVGFTAGFVALLGVLVPLALLAALAVWALRAVWRRVRPSGGSRPPPPHGDAPDAPRSAPAGDRVGTPGG